MKKSKIFLFILIVLIIIFSVLLFYPTEKSEEPIKIGAILPLSGSLSYMGEEVRNGIELAVEDINSKKLEVIYEDSKMDPKEGVSAINKLLSINNIKYVIVWGTPVISAVQPITEENKIILDGGSISPSILKDKSYTLRIFYNLDQALDKFVEFIKTKKYSKIAIFYQNGEAWESQAKGLESKGINFVIKEKFNNEENDFRTMLFKIKNTNPDLIILIGYGSNFPIIFKQIKETGLEEVPILGGLDFLEVPKENLDLYKNAIFVVPEFNINPSSKSSKFIQEYENKFNAKPSHQAAYAYDALSLLYSAANNNPDEVIKSLKSIKTFNGVVGNIKILPNGDSKSSLSFATYKDGEFVKY